VTEKQFLAETALAKLARKFRQQAKKTRAQAARELCVSQTTIFNAEETPSQSLFKIRKRLIEKYSAFKVVGPVFLLRSK
jgi:DNA-binding XRE family transcriptional regulator